MARTTDRMSAAERREAILDSAIEEFAEKGFFGATTADVARRAGISQPYVFRFFPTKKELVLAAIDRCVSRVVSDWERALPKADETRLATLGRTYVEALSERRAELMVTLHAYASAEDPDIAAAMRHHLAHVFRYVVHLLERDGHADAYSDAWAFISRGFLINAAMAVGLESVVTPDEWSAVCGRSEIARIEDRLRDSTAA